MKKLLLSVTVGALLTSSAFAQENCKTIRMGFNPAQDATKVLASAKPIANYLEEAIRGVEVKATVAQDYRGLIEAMRSKQLDFAWLNPVGYVDAKKEGVADVLLKSAREGGPYYWAALIVRSDSRIKSEKDLQGSSIAWVDPNSAAGYTFPKATLLSKGIDPEKTFSKQVFAGGHDAVVYSVLNGTVDVGAVFANNTRGTSGAWTQYLKDVAQQQKIRVLLYSKPIPGDTVSVRTGFKNSCRDTVTLVTNALLAMRSQNSTRQMLRDLYRIEYLVSAKDSDYDIVREAQAAAAKK
jgi:phosphonate transport system substrate-binding protein